jgi:hypothetical protein
MTHDPPKIDPLLPSLSLTIGMKGNDRMAPSEYAAAIMPLSEPWGLSKSGTQISRSFVKLSFASYAQSIHDGTIWRALIN